MKSLSTLGMIYVDVLKEIANVNKNKTAPFFHFQDTAQQCADLVALLKSKSIYYTTNNQIDKVSIEQFIDCIVLPYYNKTIVPTKRTTFSSSDTDNALKALAIAPSAYMNILSVYTASAFYDDDDWPIHPGIKTFSFLVFNNDPEVKQFFGESQSPLLSLNSLIATMSPYLPKKRKIGSLSLKQIIANLNDHNIPFASLTTYLSNTNNLDISQFLTDKRLDPTPTNDRTRFFGNGGLYMQLGLGDVTASSSYTLVQLNTKIGGLAQPIQSYYLQNLIACGFQASDIPHIDEVARGYNVAPNQIYDFVALLAQLRLTKTTYESFLTILASIHVTYDNLPNFRQFLQTAPFFQSKAITDATVLQFIQFMASKGFLFDTLQYNVQLLTSWHLTINDFTQGGLIPSLFQAIQHVDSSLTDLKITKSDALYSNNAWIPTVLQNSDIQYDTVNICMTDDMYNRWANRSLVLNDIALLKQNLITNQSQIKQDIAFFSTIDSVIQLPNYTLLKLNANPPTQQSCYTLSGTPPEICLQYDTTNRGRLSGIDGFVNKSNPSLSLQRLIQSIMR
jgi:hypothetical protein